MTRIELLKKLVEKSGNEKMKELIVIVENYLEGLNNIFKERDVSELFLREFDFPMFLRELQDKGIFQNKSGMQIKLLVMDVFFIARHTWEFTDKNGKTKTGNDLHNAWPLFFGDENLIEIESLFKSMQYLPSCMDFPSR